MRLSYNAKTISIAESRCIIEYASDDNTSDHQKPIGEGYIALRPHRIVSACIRAMSEMQTNLIMNDGRSELDFNPWEVVQSHSLGQDLENSCNHSLRRDDGS